MSSERLWITILALVSFLAGIAGGVLLAPRISEPIEPGPFAHYEARLVEEFDLEDPERTLLRGTLLEYERRLEKIEARFLLDTAAERADLGLQCLETIRQRVLPREAVARFDRMARGDWSLTSGTPATN
jgi:hypothetical protein